MSMLFAFESVSTMFTKKFVLPIMGVLDEDKKFIVGGEFVIENGSLVSFVVVSPSVFVHIMFQL